MVKTQELCLAVDVVVLLVPLNVILFICALKVRVGIVSDPAVYYKAEVIVHRFRSNAKLWRV
jgi:hypothetical protein